MEYAVIGVILVVVLASFAGGRNYERARRKTELAQGCITMPPGSRKGR